MAGAFAAPASSTTVQLGGGQGISYIGTYQGGGYTSLSNSGGGHSLQMNGGTFPTGTLTGTISPGVTPAGTFAGAKSAGTSLFTGVALLTDLLVVDANNNAGTFTPSFTASNPIAGNLTNSKQTVYSGTICPTGCLGGVASVNGSTVVQAAGGFFGVPNVVVGVPGQTTLTLGTTTAAPKLVVEGGPWVTGKVRITHLTTNVISMPNRTPAPGQQVGPQGGPVGVGVTLEPTSQEVVSTFTISGGFRTVMSGPNDVTKDQIETRATVTLQGTNNLASASGAGSVTLVAPLRIDTGPLGLGFIPGFVKTQFVFAPEPGTLLLLASGAAGLVLIGRRRSKK
jgi:hypothetical protein